MTTLCSNRQRFRKVLFRPVWSTLWLIGTILIAFGFPALAQKPPEPAIRPGGRKTPAAFTLAAKPSADWFALGEPIRIQCDLQNTGKVSIWVVQSAAGGDYEVEIRDEDNRILKFDTPFGINIFSINGTSNAHHIEIGQSLEEGVVIDRYNPIQKAGIYTVILHKRVYFRQKGEVLSVVQTAKIKVHIVYKYQ